MTATDRRAYGGQLRDTNKQTKKKEIILIDIFFLSTTGVQQRKEKITEESNGQSVVSTE